MRIICFRLCSFVCYTKNKCDVCSVSVVSLKVYGGGTNLVILWKKASINLLAPEFFFFKF